MRLFRASSYSAADRCVTLIDYTQGNVVVHHAVEQWVLNRYPGAVSESEMHSYENLRGIPKGAVNNSVHLSAIRKSWNRFYKKNPNPTPQQLLDHATEIDNMYGARFDPQYGRTHFDRMNLCHFTC